MTTTQPIGAQSEESDQKVAGATCIQSFGILVVIDAHCATINFISENASSAVNVSAKNLVGKPAQTVFSEDELHRFRNILCHETIEFQPEFAVIKRIGGIEYHVFIHRKDGHVILELIPRFESASSHAAAVERAKEFLLDLIEINDLRSFFRSSAERLRSIGDFDHVVFYQISQDKTGTVSAESCAEKNMSKLGQRCLSTDLLPATSRQDAPPSIRCIADANAEDVALLHLPGDEPVDLSRALLFGKTDEHAQQLRKNRATSAHSIPIMIDGALWGVFSAYHFAAKSVDPTALAAMNMAGKLIALRLQFALAAEKKENHRDCVSAAGRLIGAQSDSASIEHSWAQAKKPIAALIKSDGVFFAHQGAFHHHGTVPNDSACDAILNLDGAKRAGIIALTNLPNLRPDVDWGATENAIIVVPDCASSGTIVFLRNRTETSPAQDWQVSDLRCADTLQQALSPQPDKDERSRQKTERLDALHRDTSRLIALVQSLAVRAPNAAQAIESYAEALERRIAALY